MQTVLYLSDRPSAFRTLLCTHLCPRRQLPSPGRSRVPWPLQSALQAPSTSSSSSNRSIPVTACYGARRGGVLTSTKCPRFITRNDHYSSPEQRSRSFVTASKNMSATSTVACAGASAETGQTHNATPVSISFSSDLRCLHASGNWANGSFAKKRGRHDKTTVLTTRASTQHYDSCVGPRRRACTMAFAEKGG